MNLGTSKNKEIHDWNTKINDEKIVVKDKEMVIIRKFGDCYVCDGKLT